MKATRNLALLPDPRKPVNVLSFRLQWRGGDKSSASLVIETLVDGAPIANFNFVATDLYQLAMSIRGSGNYQVLNCWCGIPECVGLEGGVRVHHVGDTVQWTVQMSPKVRGHHGGMQAYRFNKPQYVDAITAFAKEMAADVHGTEVVLYTRHRHIQAGGLERFVGMG
jgi:hypothetical protein